MSWQPPQGQPAGQTPPDGWERTDSARDLPVGRIIALSIVGVIIVLGVFMVIRSGSDDNGSAGPEDVAAAMRFVCPSFEECGIEVDTSGPPYTFALLPGSNDTGVSALGIWATTTGCLEEVDFDRIGQTRALDGMVRSANGRSTWTYHPDDGLFVVCE